jgi:lipoprotein-anchoring transpeptidase ErfK/SrfK
VKIVITKSENSLKTYDAGGKLLSYYPSTLGRAGTPAWGTWGVTSITHDPWYKYDPKHGFAGGPQVALIPPGPNNTVGNMWMQLSAPHYGIHGVPHPENIGKQESEGCNRLTNWDAHEVAAAIDKGVRVIIQR